MTHNKQAFTLIELLVVVLIIGILAAIALPQYQKAVEKSRATEAINIVNQLEQAISVYVLENGFQNINFMATPVLAIDLKHLHCHTGLGYAVCESNYYTYLAHCDITDKGKSCSISANRNLENGSVSLVSRLRSTLEWDRYCSISNAKGEYSLGKAICAVWQIPSDKITTR